MAGELLDLRNTSPRLPLSNLICHINNPIGSPVSHCCFNRAALCAQPTNSSAMDVFQSCCPAKASLRLAPQGFPADNTNTLRHFYYEKMDGEMLFVSPRHHLNISRVTLFSQVGLTDILAGSMATLVVLVCQKALRVIIFRQTSILKTLLNHGLLG